MYTIPYAYNKGTPPTNKIAQVIIKAPRLPPKPASDIVGGEGAGRHKRLSNALRASGGSEFVGQRGPHLPPDLVFGAVSSSGLPLQIGHGLLIITLLLLHHSTESVFSDCRKEDRDLNLG